MVHLGELELGQRLLQALQAHQFPASAVSGVVQFLPDPKAGEVNTAKEAFIELTIRDKDLVPKLCRFWNDLMDQVGRAPALGPHVNRFGEESFYASTDPQVLAAALKQMLAHKKAGRSW